MLSSRRMKRAACLAQWIAGLLFSPAIAFGSTPCTASSVNTCVPSDSFWAPTGAARFIGFSSSRTIAKGELGFGLTFDYQRRPLFLWTPSPWPAGSTSPIVDHQVNASFGVALGVTDHLELYGTIPVTLYQSGSGLEAITGSNSLRTTAMGDLRFGFGYTLVVMQEPALDENPTIFGLTLRFEADTGSGDRTQFGAERTAVFAPSVVADWRRSSFFLGAQLGARFRGTTPFLGLNYGSQLFIAAGGGIDALSHDQLSVLLEARTLPSLVSQNERSFIPTEWTLSLRSAPFRRKNFSLSLGFGGSLPLGDDANTTAARTRIVFALRFAPQKTDHR